MNENTKFWKFEGYIGRRNFIINLLIIFIIELITFITPLAIFIMLNPEIIKSLSNGVLNINSMPSWLIFWMVAITLLKLVLIFPSAIRRIRDILGKDDKNIIPITFITLLIIFAGYGLPFVKYTFYVIMICMSCIVGQISCNKPKSSIIKFNWGAFWGTWIWGMLNKSFKTLWILILWPFTGILPFMLLFGLKGNEWAYKNKKYENLEIFHEKQSNQAIIFAIAFPFLIIISIIFVLLCVNITIETYIKLNPQFKQEIINYYNKVQNSNAEFIFEDIKSETGEYIFTINPQHWSKLSNKQKEDLFNTAAYYSELNYTKSANKTEKIMKAPVKTIQKVKIISAYNEETLAQCTNVINENDFPQKCNFNSYPSLP